MQSVVEMVAVGFAAWFGTVWVACGAVIVFDLFSTW